MGKTGKVTILCGGNRTGKTLQSYLAIQKYATENGFEKVKVEFITPEDNKLQELIGYLKERETELKENVRIYEEKLRQTPRENFYYNSYLKTLHRYRAKRELIKEILSKIEKR